jgi:flagellar hook-basal body complex protein FliE
MTIDLSSISAINPINIPNIVNPARAVNTDNAQGTTTETFGEILASLMNVYNEANTAQFERDQILTDFAVGRNNNILDVVLAQERAFSTLNFSVQVTNRIVEAYREIIRMQM